MEIKDLGNIVVDPNVLPPHNKKKVLAKIVKEKITKGKSNHITSNVLSSSLSSGNTPDNTNISTQNEFLQFVFQTINT